MPSTASSRSGLRVLDDVHLARRDPEGGAVLERLDLVAEVVAARAAPDPDDLVVEVVVPRRLARRHVADEHRRARRAVVRAEEDLERAAAGRLARLDRVDRDDALARAHRRVQVGVGAERDAHERDARRRPRRARPASPSSRSAAEPDSSGVAVERRRRPRTRTAARRGRRSPTSRVSPAPSCSVSSASSEPRCGGIWPCCADDTHQRPRYALRRSSFSSRSAALPSRTTRPVERT